MAVVLVACGAGTQAGASSTSPSRSQAPPPESESSAADEMWHHFLDGTEARDAVIAGHLERVRAPLQRMAQRAHSAEMPGDWLHWIEEMQTKAARGAEAKTLDEAAEAVAALGTSCGECHRTTAGGPDWTGDPNGYKPLGRSGLAEKMARHKWSADELWLGLTGPVHESWSRGAAGLMNINVPSLVDHRGAPATEERAPSGEGELQGEADPELPDQERAEDDADEPPSAAGAIDLDAALREMRELGQRADKASIPRDKEAIFAEIITRCGHCHEKLGIEL